MTQIQNIQLYADKIAFKLCAFLFLDPCTPSNGGCSQVCSVEDHTVVCVCYDGYKVDADDITKCNGKDTIMIPFLFL